jgi:long-chain acyl-CoA synthetase
MPSVLDLRIRDTVAKLTGEGGAMPLSIFHQYGVDLPVIASAPPALPHYFDFFCTQHAATEFIVAGEERLTFADIHNAARQVAASLVSGYAIQKGDRVGIAMRNAPSWIALYMGVLMAGGVAVLLNGWWQGAELATGIDDVECTLVLADTQRAQRLSDHGYAGPAKVVSLEISLPLGQALAPLTAAGGVTATPLPDLTGDDLATILFTSGSTGKSKGAFSTHRAVVQGTFNYIAQAMMMLALAIEDGKVSATPPQPTALLTVPLFHVTGEVPILLVSFALGRKLIMMPKWDVVTAFQLIEKEKITNFTGVPLMSFELMSHPDRDKYDLSTLQGLAAGGAPRPIEHVKRLSEALPDAPPALGYGLTETSGVGCGNFSDNYQEKPNSTGTASKPLVDLAILDDDGKPVPQGEKGEVSIRSIANFSGYWNRPDATTEAIMADGYFRTGDVGYLDPDGYLFIVDRKKDIIIRGGENISCQEVEATLYEHTAVAEACVFGLPDERLGEVPGAAVYLHPGRNADEAELRAHVKGALAGYNTPERIWISPEPLPRLGTEKIDKVGLRKHFQAEWAKASAK